MASMIQVVTDKLNAVAGLEAILDGETIYVEDTDGIGFTRSHDGALGVSAWYQGVLDEYEEALLEAYQDILDTAEIVEEKVDEAAEEPRELSPEYQAAELPQEEPMFNFVEAFLKSLGLNTAPAADPPAREFAPAPPVKEHAPVSDQLAAARAYNGVKEIAQALENDLQDRGGIPSPEDYIRDMKEAAMPAKVATIVTTEFRVTGVGYHAGKFSHGFDEVAEAKSFARKCSAAAVNESYAATIKIVPFTTRRAV